MIIHIDAKGMGLEDAENFRSFKVLAKAPAEGGHKALAEVAAGALRFESDDHAWVAIDALENWPGYGQDAQFRASLEAMIAKAKPFGWISEDGLYIRAHIDWQL